MPTSAIEVGINFDHGAGVSRKSGENRKLFGQKLFKEGVKLKNYTMELKLFGNTEQEYAVYECVKNFLKKDEKSA